MAGARGNREVGVETLRRKYSELGRKYATLVGRLDRRNLVHTAVFQLGSWGLQMRSVALATVSGDRILLANTRFNQLSRPLRGTWRSRDLDGKTYPDLRSLAIAEARPARDGRVVEGRFGNEELGRAISLHAEPGRQGKERIALLMMEEISEQIQRDEEMQRGREGLLIRERLRVLGELAAAVAHDLGNTLRGAGFELAALQRVSDGDHSESLDAIARRVDLASQVIGRLHDFARSGSLAMGPVRLQRIIEQAVAVTDIELKEGAHPIQVKVAVPLLPPVRGNVAELSLLFVNLLRNARDAMPKGGTITIAGRATERDALITVADQGEGFASQSLPRVFQAFFTTKGTRGTGLGLWLARSTMSRLGGSIEAANRPEGGAVLSLRFPFAQLSPAERSRGPAPDGPALPAARRRRPAPRTGSRT